MNLHFTEPAGARRSANRLHAAGTQRLIKPFQYWIVERSHDVLRAVKPGFKGSRFVTVGTLLDSPSFQQHQISGFLNFGTRGRILHSVELL